MKSILATTVTLCALLSSGRAEYPLHPAPLEDRQLLCYTGTYLCNGACIPNSAVCSVTAVPPVTVVPPVATITSIVSV